jgi:acetyltransferase
MSYECPGFVDNVGMAQPDPPRYPGHLARRVQLRDGKWIRLRPIRPEDRDIEQAFVRGLSDYSRYYRFMEPLRELPPDMLEKFTHVDYRRDMALVALAEQDGGEARQIGVARYVRNPDGVTSEFAIVVADAWQGKGVGTALMQALIGAARENGIRSMEGTVIASNLAMLQLMAHLGFVIESHREDAKLKTVRVVL